MLWIESVPSHRCQHENTAASTTEYNRADATYGTPNPTCKTSAAIVPKTPTITTVSQ